MSTEVATAIAEQTRGVEEIAKAMGQLDQVTSQNAAASKTLSTSSHALTRQSQSLFATVNEAESILVGSSGKPSEGVFAPTHESVTNKVVPIGAAKKPVRSDAVPNAEDSRFEDVA